MQTFTHTRTNANTHAQTLTHKYSDTYKQTDTQAETHAHTQSYSYSAILFFLLHYVADILLSLNFSPKILEIFNKIIQILILISVKSLQD